MKAYVDTSELAAFSEYLKAMPVSVAKDVLKSAVGAGATILKKSISADAPVWKPGKRYLRRERDPLAPKRPRGPNRGFSHLPGRLKRSIKSKFWTKSTAVYAYVQPRASGEKTLTSGWYGRLHESGYTIRAIRRGPARAEVAATRWFSRSVAANEHAARKAMVERAVKSIMRKSQQLSTKLRRVRLRRFGR